MANGAYIRVALRNNSDFNSLARTTPRGVWRARLPFRIQKTPCDFYLGQCLVTFSLPYHVYRSVWTPVLGELLNTEQEHRNY